MPIRPENKARYPKDWPEISREVRDRADQKCEWCGIPNYQLGAWISGKWHIAHSKGSGRHDGPKRGEVFPCHRGENIVWKKVVQCGLTVAHMDHIPEHCGEPGNRPNLKALCQHCHLTYDAPMHRAGRLERAKAKNADRDLFEAKP